MREIVLQKLAEVGWEEGFAQAVDGGWRGLWDYGMTTAKPLSPMNKPNCAYCFLMNVAALNRWDSETTGRMRRNLAPLRDNSAST
jgi:hypothetical protein